MTKIEKVIIVGLGGLLIAFLITKITILETILKIGSFIFGYYYIFLGYFHIDGLYRNANYIPKKKFSGNRIIYSIMMLTTFSFSTFSIGMTVANFPGTNVLLIGCLIGCSIGGYLAYKRRDDYYFKDLLMSNLIFLPILIIELIFG